MGGYAKLFSSILMSSIWEESAETRLVWVTLLALADQNGHVDGTVASLARVARVSVEDCRTALDCFLAPDPNDRSGIEDGRRIRAEDGGWTLINHATYRHRMSQDERRERDKLRKREKRAASAGRPRASANVRDVSHTEAEAEAEADQTQNRTDAVPPPAARTTVATRAAALGMMSSAQFERLHGRHALRGDICGWVCMPDFIHEELVGRLRASLGDERARQAVRAWACGVRVSWEASGRVPGDDAPAFWRNEWARTYGSNKPAQSLAYADPLKGVKDLLAKGGNLAEG